MPYREIKKNQIIFEHEVQSYCNKESYKCPNYEHSWACPPVSPYLEQEISEYTLFFLIYYNFSLKNYVDDFKKKSLDKSKDEIL
ncbi:MAG: hypothetical protein KGD63_03905 [Candidatus Lokiarchaeota archaeon]|nr:hypothetical protein [Candidatus Lokiarchaeota archaeon]